ncbi:hypothetical protein SESBI_43669 [Sesbania bispinosa]|nr:hypothetical protein SESBI_43669 [Sesbania bispinosa]
MGGVGPDDVNGGGNDGLGPIGHESMHGQGSGGMGDPDHVQNLPNTVETYGDSDSSEDSVKDVHFEDSEEEREHLVLMKLHASWGGLSRGRVE